MNDESAEDCGICILSSSSSSTIQISDGQTIKCSGKIRYGALRYTAVQFGNPISYIYFVAVTR
jgi:hypothetical protein